MARLKRGSRVEMMAGSGQHDMRQGILVGKIIGGDGRPMWQVKWDNGLRSEVGSQLLKPEGYFREAWLLSDEDYAKLVDMGSRTTRKGSMMGGEKIAMELIRVAKNLIASVRPGETYELDIARALDASWSTPQWVRLVKQLHRRADGFVTVDSVDTRRDVANVHEANNPAAAMMGSVQVPLDSLVGRPVEAGVGDHRSAADDEDIEEWADDIAEDTEEIADESTGVDAEQGVVSNQNERFQQNWPVDDRVVMANKLILSARSLMRAL